MSGGPFEWCHAKRGLLPKAIKISLIMVVSIKICAEKQCPFFYALHRYGKWPLVG